MEVETMTTTILAMIAIGQDIRPTFTMILVAGNQNCITGIRSVLNPSDDPVIRAVQKLTADSESSQTHWAVVDGSNIGDISPETKRSKLAVVASNLGATYSGNSPVKSKVKVQQISEEMSWCEKMHSISSGVSRKDTGVSFAINLASRYVETPLMITNLGAFRQNSGGEPLVSSASFKNSIGVTRQSLSEMKDWKREFSGTPRPSMILCASGEAQKGDKDLLAFPPAGVILTYDVAFDKRWSAKLKDVIRVQ
jgi:hypothetical protein